MTGNASPGEQETAAVPAPRKRAPRRPSKPDAVLAAAVDTARQGLLEVVPADEIGDPVGVYVEAERLVTHRFVARKRGYAGWQWYATLARVPRGKVATVCEVGLLPSEASLLAPEWVPWSERVRPEETAAAREEAAREEAAAEDEAAAATEAAAENEPAAAKDMPAADAGSAGTGMEDGEREGD